MFCAMGRFGSKAAETGATAQSAAVARNPKVRITVFTNERQGGSSVFIGYARVLYGFSDNRCKNDARLDRQGRISYLRPYEARAGRGTAPLPRVLDNESYRLHY